MEAIKAVIVSRVSSPDQEEGHSIDAQTRRGKEYCQRAKLNCIKIFEITESSTRGDRTKFMDMLQFCKKYKEPIAIVVDKVDRLQRSFREFPLLDSLVQQGSIELHFTSENSVIHKNSRSGDRTMWSMRVLLAQSYTDSTSDNIKRSQEHKRKKGELCGVAPLGYLNRRDENNKSMVIVDPVRGPIISKLFDEYATGTYTISDMTRRAEAYGLRSRSGYTVHKCVLHRIFQQPFYYGEMEVNGERFPHCYAPLIARETFRVCQDVRLGYHKQPFRYRGKDFIFRGLLTCATSGKIITADTKKRRLLDGSTAEYTYLMSWNPEDPCRKMWVREEVIIEQLEGVFKRLGFKDPAMLSDVLEYIAEADRHKRAHHNAQVASLKKEHTDIQRKLERLMDLRLEGEINKDEFETKKNQLKDRQYDLLALLSSHDQADASFYKCCNILISLASEARKVWSSSNTEQKRELLNFVFSNLKLEGSKLCFQLRKPMDQLLDAEDCLSWRGKLDAIRTDPAIRLLILQVFRKLPTLKVAV